MTPESFMTSSEERKEQNKETPQRSRPCEETKPDKTDSRVFRQSALWAVAAELELTLLFPGQLQPQSLG